MHRLRSASLFPTEEPLTREQMIGRETNVRELTTQLTSGVHRVVAAPRRTGKSSVCRAVVADLREHGFYSLSISLFLLADAPSLTRGLAQETLANREALQADPTNKGVAGFILRGPATSTLDDVDCPADPHRDGRGRGPRCRTDARRARLSRRHACGADPSRRPGRSHPDAWSGRIAS